MFRNPDDNILKSILKKSKNIAVVGLSENSERDSYRVAEYLLKNGYRIIPVNPNAENILGQKSYKDLASVPYKVDIVNVFRRSEHLPSIVEEAAGIKPECIWAQLGVVHGEAAEYAEKKGVHVVMDLCIKVEHQRLFGERNQ
ncbi:MAG: CoA-binding protein [Bacillota bacterium]